MPDYWGLIPAAGTGVRMNAGAPKQYLEISGRTILEHTMCRMLGCQAISGLVVCVAADDKHWQSICLADKRVLPSATGGATRAESVVNGLVALGKVASQDDWVLVHDSVRPCVTLEHIRRLFRAVLATDAGGLLALPVVDTLKKIDGLHVSTQPRQVYWLAQTPQIFRFALLHEALTQAKANNVDITDESSAIELLGYDPVLVEGARENIKITMQEDLALAEFYLRRRVE